MEHLARYLQGLGHPNHPSFGPDIIATHARNEVASNPVYRAERFLMMATGSDLLPREEEEMVLVRTWTP
jgi:hypothetical protein